ncbi:hypothetical protein [Rhodanobacter denitrificans]|uniref:hypothetical protein n=1 Tax=Rhodanobacter denitrificans TaxID=666685 RepID=UPI001CB8D0AB|nr:hypothetical protein [Rhodanobacter denitrificans]
MTARGGSSRFRIAGNHVHGHLIMAVAGPHRLCAVRLLLPAAAWAQSDPGNMMEWTPPWKSRVRATPEQATPRIVCMSGDPDMRAMLQRQKDCAVGTAGRLAMQPATTRPAVAIRREWSATRASIGCPEAISAAGSMRTAALTAKAWPWT